MTISKDEINVFTKYVVDTLIEPEKTRLFKKLYTIQEFHNFEHDSMFFRLDGVIITNGLKIQNTNHGSYIKNIKNLSEKYHDEVKHILRNQKQTNIDTQRLLNFMGLLKIECKTYQAYRDVLPDVVVNKLNEYPIKSLPRTQEVGYPYKSQPDHLKIFNYGLDIMYRYLLRASVFE